MIREVWTEFKTCLFPWILAGAVILLLNGQHRREMTLLETQLKASVAEITRVHDLLAQQGYIAPPVSTSTIIAAPVADPPQAARPRSK